jgi:hypothetical protein
MVRDLFAVKEIQSTFFIDVSVGFANAGTYYWLCTAAYGWHVVF